MMSFIDLMLPFGYLAQNAYPILPTFERNHSYYGFGYAIKEMVEMNA